MADVQYKLNFPIETPEAYAFWESRHRLNRIKAIMAFSLDKDNANDNLRRAGYYRQYRKRYLELYDCIIAHPDMKGIPLSDLTEYWYDPIAICPLTPVGPVTAFTIGDLSSLVAGQVVNTPKLTLTPANSVSDSVTFSCSPTSVADMLGTKIQLKTAGDFTLTVTVNNKSGATPATVTQTKSYTVVAAVPAPAPVITTQPSGIGNNREGEAASFHVVATGSDLSYQWQVQNKGTGAFTDIAGATSDTYTIASTVAANDDDDKFHVVITNSPIGFTPTSVTSNAVGLTVAPTGSKPRFVNDSHTAAPWNPIYVSDTEWKLDNVPISGSERFFAVWLADPTTLNNESTTPPVVGQARVSTWVSSDPTIAITTNFTPGGRGTHFGTKANGQATLTATTDKGEIIKLYVGVGAPAVTP